MKKEKIKDYTCVSKSNLQDFNHEVRRLINNGYEPIGGVSMSLSLINGMTIYETIYAQALIRY